MNVLYTTVVFNSTACGYHECNQKAYKTMQRIYRNMSRRIIEITKVPISDILKKSTNKYCVITNSQYATYAGY